MCISVTQSVYGTNTMLIYIAWNILLLYTIYPAHVQRAHLLAPALLRVLVLIAVLLLFSALNLTCISCLSGFLQYMNSLTYLSSEAFSSIPSDLASDLRRMLSANETSRPTASDFTGESIDHLWLRNIFVWKLRTNILLCICFRNITWDIHKR